eukprot:1161933-Pelagomonas_calceolata.AAC.6
MKVVSTGRSTGTAKIPQRTGKKVIPGRWKSRTGELMCGTPNPLRRNSGGPGNSNPSRGLQVL